MITLRNITKIYKKNKVKALDNVSISFPDNGFVSILGPSGCGKTTMLNIIGGLDKYTSGKLEINGVDTSKYNASDWDSYRNHNVGFVFQSFNLIGHLNILRNVELSITLSGVKRRTCKKLAKEALDKVGLQGMYNKKPNELSGGQCQRVAIARAIVNNPKIILADEPTGALDSQTSIEIMKILKELSKEHLVIMVTHNEELAKEFSSSIVRMLDGKLLKEEKVEEEKEIIVKEKKKKSHMNFFVSLSLSFRNLITKYIRSLLTIFAGSIGILGVTLVLAVSNGTTTYINKVQSDALSDYPITVRSSTKTSTQNNTYGKLEEYPTDKNILVTKYLTIYEKVSNIDEEFSNYIEALDKEKYTVIDYNRSIKMNIIKKTNNTYTKVYQSYFEEMTDNDIFMQEQYELIDGKMPTEAEEVLLIVDKYNSISETVLYSLGIDTTKEIYTTEDLIGTEFKVINNNNYYRLDSDNTFVTNSSAHYEKMYNGEGNITIRIAGIIRPREGSIYSLFSSGVLYTKALTQKVLKSALESDIVVEQLKYGINKDVFTGKPFSDSESLSSTMTVNYLYENRLIDLAAVAKITTVNIYSDSFEDRMFIEDYIKSYNNYGKSNVSYYDYMSSLQKEFSTFIEILTKVLVIFALISLFVSAIMIAIITYISVIERTKEIGILRSLGARKIDISIMFCAETLLIGICSGVLGLILSNVISTPINTLVQNILRENLSNMTGVNSANLVEYHIDQLIIILIGSVVLTVVAGLIPSIIAAFKKPIDSLRNE